MNYTLTIGWNKPVTGKDPEQVTAQEYGLVDDPPRLWYLNERGRTYIMCDSLDYYMIGAIG